MTEEEREDYFTYLDDLRESGETNMYAARPYLEEAFDISKDEAAAVLLEWMQTFEERHSNG